MAQANSDTGVAPVPTADSHPGAANATTASDDTLRSQAPERELDRNPGALKHGVQANVQSSRDPDRPLHKIPPPCEVAPSGPARSPSVAPRSTPPLPPYWENPGPLFYFEAWDLRALDDCQRSEIKAGLLAIHSSFMEGRAGDEPAITCWRQAYDIFAAPFDQHGLLTEGRLTEVIPGMVLDASASARWQWGRNSYEKVTGDWSVKFGNEYHTAWFLRDYYFKLIEGRIVDWRGKLLGTQVAQADPMLTAQDQRASGRARSGMNPIRRNARYEGIDTALTEISKARPKNHEDVFRFLDERNVPLPGRKLFKAAGGWLKGFQQHPPGASAWLSQAWGRLGLPPFARGPKK